MKFWGHLYHDTRPVDHSKLVGIFMPIWNRRELAEASYSSLIRSMPKDYPFGFIALDGGSTDGTYEYFKGHVPVFRTGDDGFPYDIDGLLTKDNTPNVGVEMWLGKYDAATDRFENEDRIGYICWIHCDMDFVTDGWLPKLVKIYESYPDMGILGPASSEAAEWYKEKWSQDGEWEIPGNVAPWIMSVEKLKVFYRRYGYMLDPGFWWPVACDDWDMHRRAAECNMKSLITRQVVVLHPSGGTRVELSDTHAKWVEADRTNRDYYRQKWGTSDDPFKAWREEQQRKRELEKQKR